MIHILDVILPCMCRNVVRTAIKKITYYRKKYTHYIIFVSCVGANMKFEIRSMPLEEDIEGVDLPRGKSWGICADSNADLAYSMLLKIPK